MNSKKTVSYISYTLFGLFAILFVPFWKSIILAGIFAFTIHPLLAKRKNTVIPNKIVIAAVTLTTLLIVTPFTLGIYSLSSELVEISKNGGKDKLFKSNNLNSMIQERVDQVSKNFGLPQTKLTHTFSKKLSVSVGDWTTKLATSIITNIPEIIINLLIFSLMLYIFLSQQNYIKRQIISWGVINRTDLNELIHVMQTGCSQCLLSLIIVGFTQAAIVLIGALVAGFEAPLLIFIITFVCSFIPIIGAAPIAVCLALFSFIDGNTGMALFLMGIATVAGTIDNIIKPILVKRGIDMDASLMLIAIIGAIIVFDLAGLFIGPVIATTAAFYFHKNDKVEQAAEKPVVKESQD